MAQLSRVGRRGGFADPCTQDALAEERAHRVELDCVGAALRLPDTVSRVVAELVKSCGATAASGAGQACKPMCYRHPIERAIL